MHKFILGFSASKLKHTFLIKGTNLEYELMNKIILLFSMLMLVAVNAQNTTPRSKTDSLIQLQGVTYIDQIKELEKQRLIDSVKRLVLEEQISSLSVEDSRQKQNLQYQLEELKKQENQRIKEKKKRIAELRKTTKGFPVIGFFNDTLFLVYSKIGSFSPEERAKAIENRIHELSNVVGFSVDSIQIIEAELNFDLVFQDKTIMSISENDALWNNTTPKSLAASYKTIIGRSVINYKHEISVVELLKEIGLVLLVLILMGVLIYYVRKLFRWTALKIIEQKGKRIKGIKIRDYQLLDAGREVNLVLGVNTIIKWFFILLIIYIALPIVFGIFPWTKNFADTLFGYILNPIKNIGLGIWNYLPKLITIIVIYLVFRYVLKGIHYLKNEIEAGNLKLSGFYADWANPTYQIIRVLLYAFMLVLIFPYLPGSDSPIFQGVSVFLGVVFTFGSSGSLSNIMAGIVLTYMRLFKIGDRVKIGEVIGDIIEKSLLVTRIRTIKNEIISIPNSTVMNSHTINYSSDTIEKGLIVHTTVTIGYDVPWKKIHEALLTAADRTDLLLKEPKPFVLQTSLDDFYVSYQINAYTKDANKQAVIYSDLHTNIQDCCNEMGIEILSPHYRAARDGNATTIPENYLDKDYKAPSFNVNVNNSGK